ncbi:Murein DD-endopeptidase MepM and murein hydrolase activator NlpD, contain LysM domain [Parasphingorhabdus marina DSM 22363]|uniref:Murein DD-endopeptidase MepM and murein hydrolase activator NlpD, contain LysM domain n=2 Tax=Parasphingorhabdus marina TaxID=394732 RepID=A0A1N6D2E8_9SPHN|nr:Murein DD-endopeptidase MepM and murein hydrolase activator NlpD, contain LysM domain [Parasphingorhabdus marina DSM 22363]
MALNRQMRRYSVGNAVARTASKLLILLAGISFAGSAGAQQRYDFPFKFPELKVRVSIAIAGSSDRVYYWYHDGTLSIGTSTNPAAYESSRPSGQPKGKFLAAAAIAGSNDHVYYWYEDGTVSQGTSTNPTRYGGYQPYSLPSSKKLAGVAIAKSDDKTYYWYTDGTRSVGSTTDPLRHSNGYLSPATGIRARTLLGVGIAGNDHVYYWYDDGTVSSGTTGDLSRYVFYRKYRWEDRLGTLAILWGRASHGGGVQQYGFDFGTNRFQSEYRVAEIFNGRTFLRPGEAIDGGRENRDWMIYGQKIYAMADGEVIACWRNAPENPVGSLHQNVTQNRIYGGGNGFWIRHDDGSRAEYAHMIPGTVPSSLCPHNDALLPEAVGPRVETSWPYIRVPNAQRQRVRTGDYLGRAGNSGTSSNPHLHIHLESGGTNPTSVAAKRPKPITFKSLKYLDLNDADPSWNNIATLITLPAGPILIRPYPGSN